MLEDRRICNKKEFCFLFVLHPKKKKTFKHICSTGKIVSSKYSRCCLICRNILSQLVVPAHVSLKIVSLYQCLLRLELTCGTSSQDLILMGQTGVFWWEHTGKTFTLETILRSNWLDDWQTNRQTDRQTEKETDKNRIDKDKKRSTDWIADPSPSDRSTNWLTLTDWLTDWLIDWLID